MTERREKCCRFLNKRNVVHKRFGLGRGGGGIEGLS